MRLDRWLGKYRNKDRDHRAGISIVEVLIVVAIIAILVLVALQIYTKYIPRSRDAHRKSDLDKIKIAFEDYYNDNSCYPGPTVLETCGSSDLSPYLAAVPCDPLYSSPYLYLPEADQCSGYRVLSRLEDFNDPIIASLGCEPGCGNIPESNPAYQFGNAYVYGISQNTPVSQGEEILDQGWICINDSGDCNACEPSGGGCAIPGASAVFAEYANCIAATGCDGT